MTPFFVGWSGRSAVPMLGFLALILLTLLVGFGALAFALGVDRRRSRRRRFHRRQSDHRRADCRSVSDDRDR